jgi:pantoate--beta-alanine ligase
MPTIRENDGLALSSRNIYLSSMQRQEALKISKSLQYATKQVIQKRTNSNEIISIMIDILAPLEISYVAIVNRNFEPIDEVEINNTVILVEAKVGETRLLDNIFI